MSAWRARKDCSSLGASVPPDSRLLHSKRYVRRDSILRNRGELTDTAWRQIAPLLPENGRKGKQWRDHRRVINGILWRLRTGAPWRDVPECYGPWQTCYDRFVRWRRDGIWEMLLTRLQSEADAAGELEWTVSVDSTVARAHQHSAGARKRASVLDAKGGCSIQRMRQSARAVVASRRRSTSRATAKVARARWSLRPVRATKARSSRPYSTPSGYLSLPENPVALESYPRWSSPIEAIVFRLADCICVTRASRTSYPSAKTRREDAPNIPVENPTSTKSCTPTETW